MVLLLSFSHSPLNFLAMQTLLTNMEGNGGIPQALNTLAASIQSSDYLNPSMPGFPFLAFYDDPH
jgi:hypothetical protein